VRTHRLVLGLLLLAAPRLAAQSSSLAGTVPADSCAALASAAPDSTAPVDLEPAPRVLPQLIGTGAPKDMVGPVKLRFIITAEGRIDTASVLAVGTADEKWLQKARRALTRARYAPAEVGHCRVPRWSTFAYSVLRR
jgi:hypothetical protein